MRWSVWFNQNEIHDMIKKGKTFEVDRPCFVGFLPLGPPPAPAPMVLNPNGYTCKTCKQVFPTPLELGRHVHALKHKAVVLKAQPSKPERKPLPTWPSHRPATCEVCGRKFNRRDGLTRHLKTVHQIVSKVPKKALKYECKVCHERFLSKAALGGHARKHMRPVQLHECPICRRKFDSQTALAGHMNVHSSPKSPASPATVLTSALNTVTQEKGG